MKDGAFDAGKEGTMGRIELSIYTPHYVPNGNEGAVIETSKGTVRVKLFGKECPVTVGNFIELSAKGFYERIKFHAYKEGSVVLGGCPVTRNMGPAQVLAATQGLIRGVHPGTGDARYTIVDEWQDNPKNVHKLGSLCFAHKSAPNSGSCQFYFSLGEQPQYDEQYTVFGETVDGLDVVESLRIGDAIQAIRIEGADEEALAQAIAQETPHPQTPQEVMARLERERAERESSQAAEAASATEGQLA